MPKITCKPNDIVEKIRQADLRITQGTKISDAVPTLGVTPLTCSLLRRDYGGLQINNVKRMEELAKGNAHLCNAISDLTPD